MEKKLNVREAVMPEQRIDMTQWFFLHGVSTNVQKKEIPQERHVFDTTKFLKRFAKKYLHLK